MPFLDLFRRPAPSSPRHAGYWSSTRHPWPCLLFLLPLLLAYELGVFWLGGSEADALRNGADTWLRWGLERFGLGQLYWPPLLVGVLFLLWSWWRWRDRPGDLFGVCLGMTLESVAFALGLWGMSRGLGPLLDHLGIPLRAGVSVEQALGSVVTFIGAGIYEEVLFRLVIFAGLCGLLRFGQLPGWLAVLLAATGSAALFAGAHHLGPHGEPLDGYVFLFRSLAGVYFAFLYQLRGFGITVGTHALYDVLVGVVVG